MISTAEQDQGTTNSTLDDVSNKQHLGNLRILNAHHVNQTQAMMRQVTAKGFGVQAEATPFPGTTTNNTTVSNNGINPWVALGGVVLTLLGTLLGSQFLNKSTSSIEKTTNTNTIPVAPVPVIPQVIPTNPNNTGNNNGTQTQTTPPFVYDPNNYQFQVVPYVPVQK